MLPQIVPACQVNLYFVKIKENTKILASFLFVDFADTVKHLLLQIFTLISNAYLFNNNNLYLTTQLQSVTDISLFVLFCIPYRYHR